MEFAELGPEAVLNEASGTHTFCICIPMRMHTDFRWKILCTDEELSKEFTTLAENYLLCASLVQERLMCPGTKNPMKNI
jgi:hypothetical protein